MPQTLVKGFVLHHLSDIFYSTRTDGETPTMVALSPLPLDCLPTQSSIEDEADLLEVDVETERNEERSSITAECGKRSNRSSINPSPGSPHLPALDSTGAGAAPCQFTRSRLANSWSTSGTHYPDPLFAPPSFQGLLPFLFLVFS